jgi:homoaconitate hydratase
MNLIEKLAQRFSYSLEKGQQVRSGDYISIQPAHVMTHDNTGAVIPKFRSIGAKAIANPRQPVFALDHDIQNTSEKNLEKYRKIEEFARQNGVDFYPAGRGIGHQIMCEEGYAFPGTMMVASDSHSNMYGGLGCLGTPIVRTDAAAIWATGRTWWQVPPVVKVEFSGKLKPGVTGKDVIITLVGFFNKDEVLNHAIEFYGEGVATLTIDQRLSIANMTTEWGALAGVFPIDAVTIQWLRNRAGFLKKRGPANVASDVIGKDEHPRINERRIRDLETAIPESDKDAYYAKEVFINLESIRPHVSGPNTVKKMVAVSEISKQNIKVDKAYLVSCVNSRLEDIHEAATVLRGKKIAVHVKFYVSAASSEVQAEAEKSGDWQTLLDAGAVPLPAGCGPCIGMGVGLLEDGEVGISATNRNFKGRMGSPNAVAYLASPAVVAASALAGQIDSPFDLDSAQPQASIRDNPAASLAPDPVCIVERFPARLEGELVFCRQDNLNTDGIYPGKYTYQDDMTPEQQAAVVMENYDPEFSTIVRNGDILAGGFNFGTGSSREQAATALKYRGIQLVVAGSFNETYKRNALNNGFLAIEAPELINDLKKQFGTERLTVKTGWRAVIDFAKSELTANGKVYRIGPVGAAAQELIVSEGLENWVKQRL